MLQMISANLIPALGLKRMLLSRPGPTRAFKAGRDQAGSGHVALDLLPKSGRTFFSMRQKTPGRWRLSEAALSLLFVCMISLSEMPGGFMYGLISHVRMRGIINARHCHYAIIIMVMQSVKYTCLLRSSVIGFC